MLGPWGGTLRVSMRMEPFPRESICKVGVLHGHNRPADGCSCCSVSSVTAGSTAQREARGEPQVSRRAGGHEITLELATSQSVPSHTV